MSAPRRRLVVGISGASAPALGRTLLAALHDLGTVETHLVISRSARRTIELELGVEVAELERLADVVHEPDDVAAPISSGSFQTIGMVVAPCSMHTLAAIATGNSTNLLTRAADVCLKERRALVLATREAPLSLIHIRNMEAATLAGATIVPPVVSFYHRPRTIEELLEHIAGRILDQVGIEHRLGRRWGERPADDARARRPTNGRDVRAE
jgi:polyprenyl P-hydroxybenzoate/phenylacrylic acid decarboxylase-like protein